MTSVFPELVVILDNLLPKQIGPTQLHYDEDYETIYGRYGSVRKATLNRAHAVAVKSLLPAGGPEDRARLFLSVARELTIWEPLSHPNLLPFTGFHVSDDYALTLLVSPWAAGGHIEGYIEKHSPDIETRVGLALDTAAGLKFLHDQKICHADLKSRNVVVLENGCAVLCDFGLANAIEENAKHTGLTTTTFRTEPQGPIPYASPELVLKTGASHSLSSDIWAWGCLLLEILTGVTPYTACDETKPLYDSIAMGKLPADVFGLQLSPDLKTLLLRCWNVKTEDRPTIDECFTRLVTAEVIASSLDQPEWQTLSNYQELRSLYNSQRLKRMQGDQSLAQETLSHAKDKLLELENLFGAAWCDSTLASVERSKCQYNSARVLQEKVLETFQGIQAEWGVASARYELAAIDAKEGKNDVARTQYVEALEAFQQLGDPSGVASCQRALGFLDFNQSKYHNAQTQYQAAFDAYQKLEDQSGVASCRLRLGSLNADRGQYETAETQLQQALEMFERLGEQHGVALCHQELGRLDFYREKYDNARSHERDALERFQILGDLSEVAWCQRNLSLTDSALEMYDEASVQAHQALETFQRLGDATGIASCQYVIGVIAAERHNYIFAQRYLLQALDAERRLGNPSGVAYCQHELGEIEYATYNYEKSRALVQEALQTFQSLGDLRGEAGSQRALALINYEEGKYDDARARFHMALEVYQRLGRQPGVEFCHEGLRKIEDATSKDRNKMKTIDWP